MTRGAKRILWIVVAIALIAVFAVTAANRLRREATPSIDEVQAAEGVPVDVVQARVTPVEDWREFTGIAKGYDQIDLMADLRTRVTGVHARVGDEVRRGKVLVSLDPYDPVRVMNNLAAAEAQYEAARSDSLRLEALYRTGAVSQQDLDHVRASCQAARVAFVSARRAVELDTPISGVVTAVNVQTGDYAEGQEVLVTIASYDRIRITLEVSDSERALLEVGQPVRVRLEAQGAQTAADPAILAGEVVRVALSADPESRLFPVELVVQNPDHRLRPGALVSPEIRVAEVTDLPAVPPLALLQQDGEERLCVVEDAGASPAARLRTVRRGVGNGRLVAVEGLAPGALVVVHGQNRVTDGAKVKIRADLTAEHFGAER